VSKKALVSGLTFIKNGLTLGYPIKESIESIEPLCDEIVINVGYDDPNLEKDDGTYEYLRDNFNHEKFIFLKTPWDPNLTERGLILSEQTNIALEKCSGKYCQYIQGDEVVHEDDLPIIHNSIMEMEKDQSIEGLVFNYLHFYGNVDIIKYTRNIYRREVRLVRNGLGIKSWLDAQGFRHQNDTKISAKLTSARIFHYGWARKEQIMNDKVREFNKLYHGKNHQSDHFQYHRQWGLHPFTKTHPEVMRKWIEEHRNDLDIMNLKLEWNRETLGLMVSDLVEKLTDYRIGEYKNYRLIN